MTDSLSNFLSHKKDSRERKQVFEKDFIKTQKNYEAQKPNIYYLIQPNIMADLANFEAAAEEWENVQEIVPTFSNDLAQHDEDSVPEEFKESLLVTIEEFITDFR